VNWLGTLCAAKQLHDILLEDDSPGGARRFIENFEKECTTWSKLVHPHIVQFLGVHFLSGSRVPILILEKMDISLRGYLEKHKKEEIPLSAKVYILRQVAQALSYLHSRSPPLVHHDLSPNNILLNEVSLVTRVTDFGMSRALDSSKMTRKSSVKGTLAFMAPEALHSPPKYDEKLDVFSYGNIAMTTVTHKWPEPGPPNRYEGDKLIAVNELQRREQYLIAFSPKENELFFPIIRSCLDNRPSLRPTSLQLVAQMRQIEASHPRIVSSGEATITQLRVGLQQKDTQLQQKDAQLQQYHTQLKDKDTQLQQKDAQIHQYRSQLTEKDTQLKQKDTQLKQKDTQLKQKDTQLKQKDTQLKQKDEDSGREYALLLQDYQQLQQERDRLKREHDQLKASQQKPSPPASVQPLSIQPHQHKTPTKLQSASKQEVESQLSKAMNPTSQLERLELKVCTFM
jgi:serine/threonine protein kinase